MYYCIVRYINIVFSKCWKFSSFMDYLSAICLQNSNYGRLENFGQTAHLANVSTKHPKIWLVVPIIWVFLIISAYLVNWLICLLVFKSWAISFSKKSMLIYIERDTCEVLINPINLILYKVKIRPIISREELKKALG